jgi:3-oxoacyl-[acyl-carrier-protein] synthase-3
MALVGCGSAVPAASITNQQLSERVDTNDDWIRTRTGIGARRVAGPEESLTCLASRAAQAALDHAGWKAEDLDLILLATSSPDDLFGTAPRVQGALGASRAVAFDLTAACSGFLFALITAGQYLGSGAMKRALVIGADQLSRWVDWDDRSTCVQGGFAPIQMNGQEVYKFAVREVPAILSELLEATGTAPDQLNWLLLHQANQRILDAVADRFAMPHDQVLSNLALYGNTSAATIPLMLDEAVKDGRVQPGHLLASSGFGAGLSWGAALLRWGGPASAALKG